MFHTLFLSPIIGQTPAPTLALINAPRFLPESLGRLLFEPHYFLWGVLGLTTLILLVTTFRGHPKLKPNLFACASILVLWMLLAYVFDTRYERLFAVNKQILDASVARNPQAVLDNLDDDFSFGPHRKPAMTTILTTILPTLAITDHTIMLFEVDPPGGESTVHINIITNFGQNGSLPTRWVLLYREGPDGKFKLHTVQAWSINDEPQKLDFPQIPGM